MIRKMNFTAVIPVRDGSKGLPDKNIRLLAGKPLYRHAVDAALKAGASRVVITTDIPEILSAELPDGASVLRRSAELAGDAVSMAPVLLHAINETHIDGVLVLLQATSPLRSSADIEAALGVYATGEHELVISVTQADSGVLKWGFLDKDRFRPIADPAYCFSNRQSLPTVVRPNGAVYVMDAGWFQTRGSFVTNHIGVIEMPPARSKDIDILSDFEVCEAFLRQQG